MRRGGSEGWTVDRRMLAIGRPTDPLSDARDRIVISFLAALLALALAATGAAALIVELKDVAPDRIERQRANTIGQLPLPNTPSIAQLDARLAEKGLALGNSAFIRIFKAESELEVWLLKEGRFVLFATYPICFWSGTLGPKLHEGDKQSPEGIYSISARQLHFVGRWPRSIDLGFPNALDKALSRTGSYILIHGGCSSTGCFGMTNPVIEEIFRITERALKAGQRWVQVQVFPFRLTEANLGAYTSHEWHAFWRNLKVAYDSFEHTHLPPRVSVCEGRYRVEDAYVATRVAQGGSRSIRDCGVGVIAASQSDRKLQTTAQSVRRGRFDNLADDTRRRARHLAQKPNDSLAYRARPDLLPNYPSF
jgi:murein L,D-transpeptidase YafK